MRPSYEWGGYQVIFPWERNDAPEGGPGIAPDAGKVRELTKPPGRRELRSTGSQVKE